MADEEIVYRDVVQPERLKSYPLEASEMFWLGRNPRAVIGTDLDTFAWPHQLAIHHDVDNDQTIVFPQGQNNTLAPWKLNGLIHARDVKTQFIANVVEPIVGAANMEAPTIEHDAEEPIVSTVAQVSSNGEG